MEKNGRISMKISENRSILGQDLSKLVVDYQNLHPGGLKSKISRSFSAFFGPFFIIFSTIFQYFSMFFSIFPMFRIFRIFPICIPVWGLVLV